jgi:lysozyme
VWDCSVPLNGKYAVPLSQANGEALLRDDLAYPGRYEGCVKNSVTYSGLNADQFSALASFTFNLGCGNFQSSTLLKLLNGGNVNGASLEFAKWVYGGGVVLPGLVRRREAERQLFCSNGACGSSGGNCIGVSTDSLNVRASPSTTAAIVGSVATGQSVTISSRTTGKVFSRFSNVLLLR